jgi:electron transfer flavoprotein beta subunit
MSAALKILVCVKRVVDTNLKVRVRSDGSGMDLANARMSINPFDEVGVEAAVQLKESGAASEVVAVSIGPAGCRDVLRTALAIGADRALLVETGDELESLAAAKCLAAIVAREQPDLVILGKQATDHDLGQTAPMLAGLLAWPQATCVARLQHVAPALEVSCEAETGSERLRLPLPAVISVDLRLNSPRYASLPAITRAKKKPLEILPIAELGVAIDRRLTVLGVQEPPPRKSGRIVPSAQALVSALRDEAKVL